MKLEFDPDDLRRGLSIVKLVKPITNNFTLKIQNGGLIIYSYDKRRSARAEIRPLKSIPSDFTSDEYLLPSERQSFLDSELTAITLTITDKGISVKTEGGKQSRQATIKRKSELSRQPPIPSRPTLIAASTLRANEFEELLRQVSCSALVRETKTEEDMRVNQVHFYPEKECAVANARFYATTATLPGMNVDLSIVSADLPLMKAFCSKFSDKSIQIGQNSKHLFIIDPDTSSHILFSRVVSNKPPFSMVPETGYETIMSIDRDQLAKTLGWAVLAIEGTQRLTLNANSDGPDGKGVINFLNGKQEIGSMPITFQSGKKFSADLPVKYLAGIVRYLGEGSALLKYSHPDAPTILEITEQADDGSFRARHFIQTMKER